MTTALTVKETDTLQRIAVELEHDQRLRSQNTRRGYLADLGAFETWRAGQPIGKLLAEEYAGAASYLVDWLALRSDAAGRSSVRSTRPA